MPPPPPNFLPANRRRQHLDPTRHLKSRELWNQVRFHASASRYERGDDGGGSGSASSSTSSSSSNNIKWATSLLQAIAYELQPFRIKPCYHRIKIFICEEQGLQKLSASLVEYVQWIITFLTKLFKIIYQQIKQTNAKSIKSFFSTNQSLLTKCSAIIIALRLYYHTILYLHELLHAGPILVILTLLTLLYTVGLGDNTGAASGVPSAYSVFNRGMRRILGTVDAEELARQYAGGMAMAGAGARVAGDGGMNNNLVQMEDDFDDDGVWVNEEEEDQEEENLVNERRRQRRLERLQQRRQSDEDGNDQEEIDGNGLAQDMDGNQEGGEDDAADNQNEQDNNITAANQNNNETTAARKPGKKARRRNLELRREMQRQRQAAAAMGFGAGGVEEDVGELEARMALE